MTIFGNKEQLSWYGEVSKHFGGYRQLPMVAKGVKSLEWQVSCPLRGFPFSCFDDDFRDTLANGAFQSMVETLPDLSTRVVIFQNNPTLLYSC